MVSISDSSPQGCFMFWVQKIWELGVMFYVSGFCFYILIVYIYIYVGLSYDCTYLWISKGLDGGRGEENMAEIS